MEKIIVYKRAGKFNKPEFLIGLDNFNIIKSKETPKAYAIGEWIDWQKSFFVDCWVAKSMCVEIEGKMFCPSWMLDKYCNMTNKIVNDYYGEEFEVREFSGEKEPEKEAEPKPAPEYCLWKSNNKVNGLDSCFGTLEGLRKGSTIVNQKELENGFILFLVSCFDKYEDGYCVFACEGNPTNDHDGKGDKFKIVNEVQFRGNCEYPSEYSNKYSGEKTFDGIKCLKDFENLKNDIYYFVKN